MSFLFSEVICSQTFKRREKSMNPNHEMRGNYVRTNDRKCQMRYPKVFTIEMTKEIDATTNDVVAPWWNISYEEQLSR